MWTRQHFWKLLLPSLRQNFELHTKLIRKLICCKLCLMAMSCDQASVVVWYLEDDVLGNTSALHVLPKDNLSLESLLKLFVEGRCYHILASSFAVSWKLIDERPQIVHLSPIRSHSKESLCRCFYVSIFTSFSFSIQGSTTADGWSSNPKNLH